jgi:sugar/nucleoside kinase (ribokinase family)
MSKYADSSILQLGKRGSLINFNGKVVKVGVIPADSVDTTGAGDLYASGFLYGLAHGLTPEQCGRIGAVTSGNVIQVIGPKMSDDQWIEIKKEVSAIMN